MKRKTINPRVAMMAARALNAPKVAAPMAPPAGMPPMPPAAQGAMPGAMPGMKKGGASKLFKGKETYGEELKEAKALKSGKISEKDFVKGEKSEGHKDEEKNPSKLAKEIKSGSKSPSQYAKEEAKEMKMCGGGMKKYGSGGRLTNKGEHPVQTKSKRGAMMVKMASGGYTKSADGIAMRGKTKGKIC